MNIDKVIKIIRESMSVGSGGFTGSASPEGPTAGFDPVMFFKKRKDGKVDRRKIKKTYKNWIEFNEREK
jgi:hypothetical protein